MDNKYRTFGPRFFAAIVDGLVLFPVGFLLAGVPKTSMPAAAYAALVLHQSLLFAYSIYLHGAYGQTVGKRLMKIRVLSEDETRLSMRQAVLRDSIGLALTFVYLLFAIEPIFSGFKPESREFEERIPLFLGAAGLVAFAIELATMLTNKKRRALHDYIAGSVVVRSPGK